MPHGQLLVKPPKLRFGILVERTSGMVADEPFSRLLPLRVFTTVDQRADDLTENERNRLRLKSVPAGNRRLRRACVGIYIAKKFRQFATSRIGVKPDKHLLEIGIVGAGHKQIIGRSSLKVGNVSTMFENGSQAGRGKIIGPHLAGKQVEQVGTNQDN